MSSNQIARTETGHGGKEVAGAAAGSTFKQDKPTLKNLNNASADVENVATDALVLLKDAEKTKSSTPITKHNNSKNVSAAHSNSKGMAINESAGGPGNAAEVSGDIRDPHGPRARSKQGGGWH